MPPGEPSTKVPALETQAPNSSTAPVRDVVDRNPTHIWIEPTNRCNTRCRHCGHFYEQFGQDMEEDLYRKIARDVLTGVKRAELIGYGEPFMAKNFWTMFDECVARGIEIYTTSNGILLRDDARVSKVVRNNVTLCLSVDGARAETHERVRPYIKWKKQIETLECIKRNADAAGPERKFKLRFNYCAMKHSIADLPDLVRLAHQYGAGEIFVLPLGGEEVFKELTGQSLHASPELVSPAYMEALRLGAEYGVVVDVPDSFGRLIVEGADANGGLLGRLRKLQRKAKMRWYRNRHRGFAAVTDKLTRKNAPPQVRAKAGLSYCNMPWNDAYFASDGTVFPCCVMSEKLGNMKQQEWKDIWNGQAYRSLRRTVHSWNPSSVCRHCALPIGINGGDERQYTKYFARFREEKIPIDDKAVLFSDAFYDIERTPTGEASHRWMKQEGSIELPMRSGAKFLRVEINPRSPVPELNPGQCTINGGEPEAFDNTCPVVHFPIDHVTDEKLFVSLAMENVHRVEGDNRDLALAIRGLAYLS